MPVADVTFTLNLCADCLSQLNHAAMRSSAGMKKERAAMVAGAEIASGSNDVALIIAIANWKSPRRRALIKQNSPAKVKVALGVARSAGGTPNQKIQALCMLDGVGPPMASAIMTAMFPTLYTVIDVRALDTLGVRGRSNYAPIYSAYLSFCIEKAAAFKMGLRDFDRALWKAGAA